MDMYTFGGIIIFMRSSLSGLLPARDHRPKKNTIGIFLGALDTLL